MEKEYFVAVWHGEGNSIAHLMLRNEIGEKIFIREYSTSKDPLALELAHWDAKQLNDKFDGGAIKGVLWSTAILTVVVWVALLLFM